MSGVAPEYIREQIQSLQTSSPLWKLRVNCLYYCRFVHVHHHGEDISLFPTLKRTNPALGPVVDKLMDDHRKVSSQLDQVEASANEPGVQDGITPHTRLVQALTDLSTNLLEHLAFEEGAIGPTILEWETWQPPI